MQLFQFNHKGSVLLQTIIASAVAAISLTAMNTLILNTYRAERGVASNGELNLLSIDINRILSSKDMCSGSSIVTDGISVAPLLSPNPSPVPISIRLGVNTVIAGANVLTPSGTRRIEKVDLTALVSAGSADEYLATLELKTRVVGEAMTSRSPNQSYLLPIKVDPLTKQIISCGGRTADKGAESFSVSMDVLQDYNNLLTNHCDGLVQNNKVSSSWLFLASACRRYCVGCTAGTANCNGVLPGQGYAAGYPSECNGVTNTALCVCVR